jgi:hypothetical protein
MGMNRCWWQSMERLRAESRPSQAGCFEGPVPSMIPNRAIETLVAASAARG